LPAFLIFQKARDGGIGDGQFVAVRLGEKQLIAIVVPTAMAIGGAWTAIAFSLGGLAIGGRRLSANYPPIKTPIGGNGFVPIWHAVNSGENGGIAAVQPFDSEGEFWRARAKNVW